MDSLCILVTIQNYSGWCVCCFELIKKASHFQIKLVAKISNICEVCRSIQKIHNRKNDCVIETLLIKVCFFIQHNKSSINFTDDKFVKFLFYPSPKSQVLHRKTIAKHIYPENKFFVRSCGWLGYIPKPQKFLH